MWAACRVAVPVHRATGRRLLGSLATSSPPTPQLATQGVRDRARSRIAALDTERAPPTVSPALQDRYARQHNYLRISLTEKCNLRCMYCMPEEGVDLTPAPKLLTTDEVVRLAQLFVRNGVTKIRLTGGEPTVRRDLPEILQRLGALREEGLQSIGMTSNGVTLPRKLPGLVEAGLTHLNLSLDTLDPFKFEIMTRRPAGALGKVMAALDMAQELPLESVKLNVVILKGLNDSPEELRSFIDYTRDHNVVVRFIEYMPFDGNKWQTSKLVPYQDLLATITQMYGPLERMQDDKNDTSKHWRVPGYQGSVGFITSMTEHFCGTCNRLRITADGNLKVCLFGQSEVSLRDYLRGVEGGERATDDQLLEIIAAAVGRKHAKHAAQRTRSNLHHAPVRPPVHHTLHQPSSRLLGTTLGRNPFTLGSVRSLHTTRPAQQAGSDDSNDFADAWDDMLHFDGWQDVDPSKYLGSTLASDSSNIPQSTQVHASNLNRFSDPSVPEDHKTWSQYMGTSNDEDNPWGNLDAFADSNTALAPLPQGSTPFQPSPFQSAAPTPTPSSAPASATTPQVGDSAETLAMKAMVAQMVAAQPSSTLSAPAPAPAPPTSQPNVASRAATPRTSTRTSSAPHGLTHIAPAGHANEGGVHMVDVSSKPPTKRSATAQGRIWLPSHAVHAVRAAEQGSGPLTKGPVFHTAQLAGIMGAKRVAELIPLCHPLALSQVEVTLAWDQPEEEGQYVVVRCTARTTGPTGVEMEALTGASVACLTVWDMVKAVAGEQMVVDDLKVMAKSGGKSGDWTRDD